MKKVILVVLVAGFVAAMALPQAWGQEKKAQFSLNVGVQTNVWQGTSFDNAWFTLDARVGIALGKSFEISPEVMVMVDDSFNFDAVWLYPGVMLNYKSGGFFLGAGAVLLPIAFGGGESETATPAPKINIGYRYGNFQFTIYALTWTDEVDFLDMNFVGATIGYRF